MQACGRTEVAELGLRRRPRGADVRRRELPSAHRPSRERAGDQSRRRIGWAPGGTTSPSRPARRALGRRPMEAPRRRRVRAGSRVSGPTRPPRRRRSGASAARSGVMPSTVVGGSPAVGVARHERSRNLGRAFGAQRIATHECERCPCQPHGRVPGAERPFCRLRGRDQLLGLLEVVADRRAREAHPATSGKRGCSAAAGTVTATAAQSIATSPITGPRDAERRDQAQRMVG